MEAPAVVRLRTPRPRISHSQSGFWLSSFICLSCIFLSRYRSASCILMFVGVLLRYALPVGCSLLCLFHPVPTQCQKICVLDLSSQRNISVSFSRHLSCNSLISYREAVFTIKPTPIPFKLDYALKLVTLFDWTRWLCALFGPKTN